jgi:uncharacterized protein (TIGR03067 family)
MFRTAMLVSFAFATVFVVSIGSLTGAAPVPKHLMKEPESDKAKLQGKWKVESLTMGGKDVLGALGQNFDIVIEFQGDQFIATSNIGDTTHKTTSTLKYGASGTRQLTTTNTQMATNNGQPMNHEKDETIGYAFDGDKLLLGSTGAGGRGAVDPLKPGQNDLVIVLVRVK